VQFATKTLRVLKKARPYKILWYVNVLDWFVLSHFVVGLWGRTGSNLYQTKSTELDQTGPTTI
jgi:hypothetical protein